MADEEVTKSRFKAQALEYFRRVEASGQSVVITDRGKPTIEVRRYRHPQRTPLERLRGSVIELERATEPVADDDWEAVQ